MNQRADLQAQIDAMQAELEALPPEDATLAEQVTALQSQVKLLAYLHAERDHHLLHAFELVTNAINVLAWLHAERAYQLEQFVESEQRLITRARAVKAAQTQAANRALGVEV